MRLDMSHLQSQADSTSCAQYATLMKYTQSHMQVCTTHATHSFQCMPHRLLYTNIFVFTSSDRMLQRATHVSIRHFVLGTFKTHIIHILLDCFCLASFGLKLFHVERFSCADSIDSTDSVFARGQSKTRHKQTFFETSSYILSLIYKKKRKRASFVHMSACADENA